MYRMLFLCLCFSGCASIVNGSKQEISVSSNPPGAKVYADGLGPWEAPTTLRLKGKTDHLLLFTKDGYEPESRMLTREVSGAVFGNIFAGGLIGWGG